MESLNIFPVRFVNRNYVSSIFTYQEVLSPLPPPLPSFLLISKLVSEISEIDQVEKLEQSELEIPVPGGVLNIRFNDLP